MDPDINSSLYLQQLQSWIANHQSPISQIDVSFDGWLSDKYEKPIVIQQPVDKEPYPPNEAKGGIQGFWLWFLVALGILATVVAFWYVRSKKG